MTAPQNNQRIAGHFHSIADLLAAQRANPYRIRAYRRGADSLLALEEDVADVAKRQALEEIDGIGKDLSEKIEEFLKTGRIQTLDALKTPLPEEVRAWATLPGLSEPLIAYFYGRLSIRTIDDLERLVHTHMLRTLPGFSGSEADLLDAIEVLRRRASL